MEITITEQTLKSELKAAKKAIKKTVRATFKGYSLKVRDGKNVSLVVHYSTPDSEFNHYYCAL